MICSTLQKLMLSNINQMNVTHYAKGTNDIAIGALRAFESRCIRPVSISCDVYTIHELVMYTCQSTAKLRLKYYCSSIKMLSSYLCSSCFSHIDSDCSKEVQKLIRYCRNGHFINYNLDTWMLIWEIICTFGELIFLLWNTNVIRQFIRWNLVFSSQ